MIPNQLMIGVQRQAKHQYGEATLPNNQPILLKILGVATNQLKLLQLQMPGGKKKNRRVHLFKQIQMIINQLIVGEAHLVVNKSKVNPLKFPQIPGVEVSQNLTNLNLNLLLEEVIMLGELALLLLQIMTLGEAQRALEVVAIGEQLPPLLMIMTKVVASEEEVDSEEVIVEIVVEDSEEVIVEDLEEAIEEAIEEVLEEAVEVEEEDLTTSTAIRTKIREVNPGQMIPLANQEGKEKIEILRSQS